MVRSLVDQQRQALRPILVANIETRAKVVLVLVLRNAGQSPATDVRIRLDRDFLPFGKSRKEGGLATISAFKEKIASIAPGDTLRFDLAQGFVIFAPDANPEVTPPIFSIRFQYAWAGMKYDETQVVDLNPYLGSTAPTEESTHELGNISKSLAAVANALSSRT